MLGPVIFAVAFFLCAALSAEVRLCGVQNENLNLRAENNPYLITGDILIKKHVQWDIGPDVAIRIAPAPACTVPTGDFRVENKGGLIAIYVKGAFRCAGNPDRRIVIGPREGGEGSAAWYGLVFDNADADITTLLYTDISGALIGVQIHGCSPVVRNCLIEKNQTGIFCGFLCNSRIHNNNIMDNASTGILNKNAAPRILNNIISGNRIGIWSDAVSDLDVEYNDFWGNRDDDFMECPPKYGVIVRVNARADSCDFRHNIFKDPVFSGPGATYGKGALSGNSRLINAGSPKAAYTDADGSVSDIGMTGASALKP